MLLGPVSFLLLARSDRLGVRPLDQLSRLLPVYEQLLGCLEAAHAREVQIDEPCLVGDLDADELAAVERSWHRMANAAPALELALVTYFGGLGSALERVFRLPAREFQLDLVRAPEQLEPALEAVRDGARLSLGIARRMVARWGMSEAIGPMVTQAADADGPLLPGASEASPDTQRLVDEEVRRILTTAHAEVTELLTRHRERLDDLAHALLEHETLDGPAAYRAAGVRSPAAVDAAAPGPPATAPSR